MMIFYAAFRQIPHEVLEAARLDGAGEWALFRRIKVPMIRNAVWVARAAVRDRRLPGLRPVLRAHQRRPVRRDRDPDDVPREDGVPQRRGGLRVGDGGRAHGDRARRRARVLAAAAGARAEPAATRREGRGDLQRAPASRGERHDRQPAPAAARELALLRRARVLLPDGLDGAVELQDERAIFSAPFALPTTIDFGAGPRPGRSATSASTRSTARSSRPCR